MIIHDNIHGYIKLDSIASKIIDTPIFQRLRYIHQTGLLYLVFPTATHTRFEHSIGTYYLAKKMITHINQKQPELNITDEIIMLVSIAGLCHDLGHLLFSHLFDDYFVPKILNKKINLVHEERSIFLLQYIIKKYNINLNEEQLLVINNLINPKIENYNNWLNKYKIGTWIFQIISNPINSIDIDKFDYITRDSFILGLKLQFDFNRIINDAKVINNEICYSRQCRSDIYYMFFIRYRLHREIYNHKTVKAIEILMIKLLFELEEKYKISEYLLDVNKMIKLIDPFIFNFDSQILNDIYERKLPKIIYEEITLIPNNNIFDHNEDYEIMKFKVGYIGSNPTDNPLNHIKFYNLKSGLLIDNEINNFSLLINSQYQEYILRIYYKGNYLNSLD